MANWHKKIFVGSEFDLRPYIVQARAILAVPDVSKRKSEFRVIQESNLSHAAVPGMEPRVFIECCVADHFMVEDWIFDAENHRVYKSQHGKATGEDRVYLRESTGPLYGGGTWPDRVEKFTNLEETKRHVLGDEFFKDKK